MNRSTNVDYCRHLLSMLAAEYNGDMMMVMKHVAAMHNITLLTFLDIDRIGREESIKAFDTSMSILRKDFIESLDANLEMAKATPVEEASSHAN